MALFTALGIGLAAAGTITDVVGKVKAGNAAKRASELQAQAIEGAGARAAGIGAFNAAVAELQAKDALVRGAQDESKFRSGVRMLIGSQRVGFASGNIDVSYGSAADVQADAAFLGELDAMTIRNNAAREAWGYRVNAANASAAGGAAYANARAEAKYVRMSGDVQQSMSRLSAGGTLLGFGINLANTYRPGPRTSLVAKRPPQSISGRPFLRPGQPGFM